MARSLCTGRFGAVTDTVEDAGLLPAALEAITYTETPEPSRTAKEYEKVDADSTVLLVTPLIVLRMKKRRIDDKKWTKMCFEEQRNDENSDKRTNTMYRR